jgi:histone H3/H4
MTRTKNTPEQPKVGEVPKQLAAKKKRVKHPAKKAEVVTEKGRRKPKHKPGVVALSNIRKERKSKKAAMRRGPFLRLVKELAQQYAQDDEPVKFSSEAKSVLHSIFEQTSIECMRGASQLAMHRGAPMLTAKDIAQYEAVAGSPEVAASIRNALLEPQEVLLKCQERSKQRKSLAV